MGLGLSKLWKGSSSPAPAGPTPEEKTAASDQQAQIRADYANRPTIETPWGTESWTGAAGTDPYGNPITNWTMKTTLDPQSQATLDAQQAGDLSKAQTAQQQLGRIQESFATPFDWQNLQSMAGVPQAGNLQGGQGILAGLDMSSLGAMPQADAAERQRIENMMFERMRPEHQASQQALETKLQNMGLTRENPQFDKELQRLQDNQARERFNAMEMGGQEMQRLFNMGLQGRQQGWQELLGSGQFQNEAQAQKFLQESTAGEQNYGQQMRSAAYQNQLRQQQIAEQMQQRNMPLNEYNALMSGTQVGMPDMPDFSESAKAGVTDYAGAARDAYNAKQAKKGGLLSGLAGIGGSILGGPIGGALGSAVGKWLG